MAWRAEPRPNHRLRGPPPASGVRAGPGSMAASAAPSGAASAARSRAASALPSRATSAAPSKASSAVPSRDGSMVDFLAIPEEGGWLLLAPTAQLQGGQEARPANYQEPNEPLILDQGRSPLYILWGAMIMAAFLLTATILAIAVFSATVQTEAITTQTPASYGTGVYIAPDSNVTQKRPPVHQLNDPNEDTPEPPSTFLMEGFMKDRTSQLPESMPDVPRWMPHWYQNVDAEDPRYTDPRHRFVCVFHANADGLTATNGVRFGIERFPFALCHVALFCCPPLTANLEAGVDYPDALMEEFLSRALRNPYPEPAVMLGDGSPAWNIAQFQTLLKDLEAGTMDHTNGAWYKLRNFAGIVLRCPGFASSEMWHRVLPLLALLRDRLMARHGLSMGLALRQDSTLPGFSLLASNFSLGSIYLLPPRVTPRSYASFTFSYFTEKTLAKMRQVYQHASRSGAGNRVCYLFPADTYTFTVARNESPLLGHQVPSLGPGIQGPVTRHPGRMAHFETCHLVPSYQRLERTYDVLAALEDSWLSYTTNALLGHFLHTLHQIVSDTCLGIWNPHWDDFANACSYKRAYPLTGAIFRLYNNSPV